MKPRPYQTEALQRTNEAFRTHNSALVVMATGLGKTVCFADYASKWPDGRVLILAHREELVQQAADKLRAFGVNPAIEMADSTSINSARACPVVVGSVQSVGQSRRLSRFDPQEFGLLITDECHHAVADSYRRIFDHFLQRRPSKHLGVTATPQRADNLAMGQIYETVAYEYGIAQAVEDGWLVPVSQMAVKVRGLDFSRARTLAGDFNEADLEQILTQEDPLHRIAASTVEIAGDRPTLVFAVTVNHAKLLAAVLNRYKPGSAVHLSGKSDKEERRQTIADFRAGRLQTLVNCGLFLEGFDAPNTSVVVMARPTKSLSLYIQVLGRGTRPLPGVVDVEHLADSAELRKRAIADSEKPSMTVLDFVGNSGRHKIVTALDVLGGKYGTPVREYARELVEDATANGSPILTGDCLEQAADETALLAEIRELERRRQIVARPQYEVQSVSPFEGGTSHAGVRSESVRGEPPTEKQRWYLVCRLGWTPEAAGRITKAQASAVIGKSRGAA